MEKKILAGLRYLFGLILTIITFIMILLIFEELIFEISRIYKFIFGVILGGYWGFDFALKTYNE